MSSVFIKCTCIKVVHCSFLVFWMVSKPICLKKLCYLPLPPPPPMVKEMSSLCNDFVKIYPMDISK